MSEIKLLPCPFCGGEAYFPTITKTFIVCKSCGFETEYTEDTECLANTPKKIIHQGKHNNIWMGMKMVTTLVLIIWK